MTDENMMIVTCPHCGRKSEFVVMNTLNGELNPYEKHLLLEGKLFEANCECSNKIDWLYEMVYHDPTNNAIVYLIDEENVCGAYTALAMQMKAINNIDEYVPRQRIVSCQHRLREKAIIFEQGRDDRVIELMKLFCLASVMENTNDMEGADLFFCVDEGVEAFEVHGVDRSIVATIPEGVYEHIEDQFAEYLEDDVEPLIDEIWAMNILELDQELHPDD